MLPAAQELFPMTRSFLRMLSGAAGLLAAFTAIALPLLVISDSASEDGWTSLATGTVTLLGVRVSLAIAALLLLRFSLSHTETERLLKFHSRSRQ
jgi:hypothetical protein